MAGRGVEETAKKPRENQALRWGALRGSGTCSVRTGTGPLSGIEVAVLQRVLRARGGIVRTAAASLGPALDATLDLLTEPVSVPCEA